MAPSFDPATRNIVLSKAENYSLALKQVLEGTEFDISTADLRLVIFDYDGTILIDMEPDADPANAKGRMINFTIEQAALLGDIPRDYIVRLETTRHAFFKGKITAEGHSLA